MAEHPYQKVPDNLSFSRSHFSTQWWGAEWSNLGHLVDARQRPAVGEFYLKQLVPQLAEADVMPPKVFDETTDVTAYAVKCIFWAEATQEQVTSEVEVLWRVATQDSAGGQLSLDAQRHVATIRRLVNYSHQRDSLTQLAWPGNYYDRLLEIRTEWVIHYPLATLVQQARVLRILAQASILQNAITTNVYLRAVVAYGLRGASL